MSTLKGELLPYVVKKQLSKHCKNVEPNGNLFEEDEKYDIFNISKKSDFKNNIRLVYSSGNNMSNSEDLIKCYTCVMNSNIGVRANTLYDYCRINKIVST